MNPALASFVTTLFEFIIIVVFFFAFFRLCRDVRVIREHFIGPEELAKPKRGSQVLTCPLCRHLFHAAHCPVEGCGCA